MDCNAKNYCRERIERVEYKLERRDNELKAQGEKIAEIKTDISHLTKSLDGVTKALWALSTSIAASLLGFFIWYIQNI